MKLCTDSSGPCPWLVKEKCVKCNGHFANTNFHPLAEFVDTGLHCCQTSERLDACGLSIFFLDGYHSHQK